MEIGQSRVNNFSVLSLKGAFSVKSLFDVRKALEELKAARNGDIALNLEQVDYLDSSSIGLMLNFKKLMEQAGGYFAIYNVSENLMDIIRLANCQDHLNIFATESDFKDSTQI